jgi:hypothetical protein
MQRKYYIMRCKSFQAMSENYERMVLMQSVLEELYHGRVCPWERCPTQSSEREKVNHRIEEEKRNLIEKLSLNECGRLESLENLYTQSSDLEQVEAFSHGFKLGVELIVSVFMDRK